MKLAALAAVAGALAVRPPAPPCLSPVECAAASAAASPTPALDFPLENDGSLGAPDADVDAAAAWAITRGDPSIIVAILDTGVDVTHPELASQVWTNPGEIPGNGIDDDGDGLIDDVHGWDFADGDANVLDDASPHGTLVAGLIAGAATGLAPDVTILPIKVFSSSGSDPNFEAVATSGIEFALAKGARVIQISWELGPNPPGPQLSAAFDDALAAGALVVVAAGNEGLNLTTDPRYPAALPLANVIGVASTDRYDQPFFIPGLFETNYGVTWVELAAPSYVRTTIPGGGHLLFAGTSASAPLVSAAAALAWSANPSATAQQIRDALVLGADRLPQLETICLGSGRLNAGNTVRIAKGAPPSPPLAVVSAIDRAEANRAALFDGSESLATFVTGTALTARWSFGDGAGADSLVAEHAFAGGGDWAATLEVTDPAGLTHVDRATVAVPLRGVPTGQTIESAHPYSPVQQSVAFSAPGAAWTRIHFSHIETAGSDTVVVYDGSPSPIRGFQGTFDDVDVLVKGGSGFVYLRGFTGGTYGFQVDRIDAEMPGATNASPVARTNAPITAIPGLAVTLSAAASTDPDGDPLSFAWRLVSAPTGSTAQASATSGATITFTPDRAGAYAFALTASDGTTSDSTLAWIVTKRADSSGWNCDVALASPRGGALAFPGLLTLLTLTTTLLRSSVAVRFFRFSRKAAE
ncbi:MAG TPA: S8 family serine peptidase [bacterium]|nr:S8 family serine peptidase [bacterium]